MSIPLSKIKAAHWVRSHAVLVNKYFETIPTYKKDFRMWWVDVDKSIVYNALITNDYTVYSEHMTTSNQIEHSVELFKKLYNEWDITKCNPISVTYDGQCFCITDGLHRLAILMEKGIIVDSIPKYMLSITYTNEQIQTIKDALSNTTKQSLHNGWSNRGTYGYHSFHIHTIHIQGQRNPIERIQAFRSVFSFNHKIVIDFGCNTGGMLFHLDEITKGVGVEYDKTCIDACQTIQSVTGLFPTYTFYQRDLNTQSVIDILENETPDVAFLLSLGSWIQNWQHLYEIVFQSVKYIFLETNNNHEGEPQLAFFRKKECDIQCILEHSKDDSTGNYGRKTYLITKT